MLFLLVMPILANQALVYVNVKQTTSVNDFVKIYLAAEAASKERPYDPDVQAQLLEEITRPLPIPTEQRYCWHTPVLFALVKPLALMPIKTAYCAWLAVSLLCGLSAVTLLARDVGLGAKTTTMIILGTLCSLCQGMWFLMGQTTWFQIALLCVFYWAMFRSRNILSGIALGFTIIKPQLSVLFFFIPLARKCYSILAAALGTLLGLLIYTMLVMRLDAILSYGNVLFGRETSKVTGNFTDQQTSLRGFLSIILPHNVALGLAFVLLIACAALVFYMWSKSGKMDKQSCHWLMAVTVAANAAFSPHAYIYDDLVLIIPAILTLKSLSFFDAVKVPSLSLRVWTLTLLCYPFLSWAVGPLPDNSNIGFQICNLTLFVSGLIYVLKEILPSNLAGQEKQPQP